MRSFVGRTIILGTCAVTGLLWSGCTGNGATEYVTGISTQVKVPRDIKAVRLEVSVDGAQQFCKGYTVYNGVVQLPRSLGTFGTSTTSINGTQPITYTIVGVADGDLQADFFTGCGAVNIGQGGTRVLRRSTQPYIKDEIRYIPMPLRYSCFDKQCDLTQTCKAGKCVSAELSADQAMKVFPKYTPGLVDGSSGGCFDAKACLTGAALAVVVDEANCVYAVANSTSAPPPLDPTKSPFPPLPSGTPWLGTNVSVIYDGGLNSEVLDLDAEECFFVPDATKPQQFKLAPGLCELVKGYVHPGKEPGELCTDNKDCLSDLCVVDPDPTKSKCGPLAPHRISSIRASGICQSKRVEQPFCIGDQFDQMGVDRTSGVAANATQDKCTTFELKPPKSALMVIVDNTQKHKEFFNADVIKGVSLPLQDPAFERTDIGLMYAPGAGACATNAVPAIALSPAAGVQSQISQSFLDLSKDITLLPTGQPNYQGALTSAYNLLTALPSPKYFKRAVLVIGNGSFDATECPAITGKPSVLATAARTAPADATKPISTYVFQLAKSDINAALEADVLDPGLAALFAAGSTDQYTPDARGTAGKVNAQNAFEKIIDSLATCVYDVPTDVDKSPSQDDVISFADPITGETTTFPGNQSKCSSENADGDGWGYGTSPDSALRRIFLCNNSCTTYRKALSNASSFALLYQQPALPVPLFWHKKSCDVK